MSPHEAKLIHHYACCTPNVEPWNISKVAVPMYNAIHLAPWSSAEGQCKNSSVPELNGASSPTPQKRPSPSSELGSIQDPQLGHVGGSGETAQILSAHHSQISFLCWNPKKPPCSQGGRRASHFPGEVGCRGFPDQSLARAYSPLDIEGERRRGLTTPWMWQREPRHGCGK